MIVNLAWPRPEIYDLTGETWWLQWSAVLFIGATLVVGFLVHLRNRRAGRRDPARSPAELGRAGRRRAPSRQSPTADPNPITKPHSHHPKESTAP